MRYEHFEELPGLIERKLISCRPHPKLPLFIYNYTARAQTLTVKDWNSALCDCRGLILDYDGEVVGRPFTKFWNYEQVLDQIPGGLPFTVWEKLDGSLGIVCNYRGSLIVATRGSFESEQAQWAQGWLNTNAKDWLPAKHYTYLFEILYPKNRIVVDYGDTSELRLLAVMEADGKESLVTFYAEDRFPKVRCFAPTQVQIIQDSILIQDDPGKEGYVLRWTNGFRAKVKFEEYKRLHRLITQVSTRSIWELLRSGKSTAELIERVPDSFRDWVNDTINKLVLEFAEIDKEARLDFAYYNHDATRKEFAEVAKTRKYPSLLFALLNRHPTDDIIWRMVEPKWATPFRPGAEE